ncbi:Cytochrome bo(3) ubiquinol oxidase subunit 4 (plasmid) [Pseudoalteromonas sp. THAF3]|uniref:cytochrome o ubiquinol oxidase subunit IV n=1 Tax=unclassified Pseudoalteromonas TaxID=194690 RepID=UPI0006B4B499|nr:MULTISPECIES: cytochrome o ubiquinol oxidase subunit IV [unclassified Pseudoalteromonas]QFU06979.1 Cytochrome bo(3) ubiquinol oxidase subunit 4 [Pseudoalteromonas sp. THAF3]GAP73873.1 cytochrome O ubiquinol oxidase subunit IV [Pseudoalteromonas sp. SW0106-04]
MSHSETHAMDKLEAVAEQGLVNHAKDYVIGFVLSVVLTGAPFWAVSSGVLSTTSTLATVVVAAIVQICVHLKYFLHLNFVSEEGKANSISFIFSALIIVMVVGLSVWIIYESNAMMMY